MADPTSTRPRVLIFVVLGILAVLGVLLLVGILQGDETTSIDPQNGEVAGFLLR